MDAREFLLTRLQDVIKAVKPGVDFALPAGGAHRAITTDLGGRVYNKLRAEGRTDASETPCVEILTSSRKADTINWFDAEIYTVDMEVEIWIYLKADDQGDGKDSELRSKLDAARADILIALEAFPAWTGPGPGQTDAASLGRVINAYPTEQYTDVPDGSPDGFALITYTIHYAANRRFP